MRGTHQIVLITQSGKPYDKGANGILINLASLCFIVCLFVCFAHV